MQTVPAHASPTARHDLPFSQRPGTVTALRTLCVVVGVVGAGLALFVAGFIAVIADCSGDATGLCTNYAGLVPVLEWALVLAAVAAPLAGGIAACVRMQWPWVLVGLVTGAGLVLLTGMVAQGQTGLLS